MDKTSVIYMKYLFKKKREKNAIEMLEDFTSNISNFRGVGAWGVSNRQTTAISISQELALM